MGLTSWDQYLFKEDNLMALHPLKTNVQLFTILLKKDQERGHPVLKSIGSLADICSATLSNSEWNDTADKIRSYRKGQLEDEDGVVEKSMNGLFKCNANQSCGVLARMLNLLGINGARSQQISFEAHNVQTDSIDSELKEDLFRASDPLWVPNMERIQLENPISKDGLIDLWIVTEVKYCTDMVREFRVQDSGGTNLGLPAELTGNFPVDCKVEITNGKSVKIIAKGEKVPIGFKAVRLVYDSNGKLQGLDSSLGKVRPYVRAGNDQGLEFDPDNDPFYHMADLYDDDGSQQLCLEIE